MDDESALLDTIAAAPDGDDLPRLVYADWLEERGDADRAAFIRAHVQLVCTPAGPEFERLAGLASDLFTEHYADWLADLVLPGEPCWPALRTPKPGAADWRPWHLDWGVPTDVFNGSTFRGTGFRCHRDDRDASAVRTAFVGRGLADQVMVNNRPVDLTRHPVVGLGVRLRPDEPPVLALPAASVRRVRYLTLNGGSADAVVTAAEACRAVTTLHLLGPFDGGFAPIAAAASGSFGARVRSLAVHDQTSPDLAELAGWPPDRLDELKLNGRVPTAALATWPLARGLRKLNLRACDLGTLGFGVLADGPAWNQLTDLDLSYATAGPRQSARAVDLVRPTGYEFLGRSAAFPCVEVLKLAGTPFGDNAAGAFAASAWPGRLRYLDVTETPVTPAGLIPLARRLRDGPLEQLRVTTLALGPAARSVRDLLGARLVEVPARRPV